MAATGKHDSMEVTTDVSSKLEATHIHAQSPPEAKNHHSGFTELPVSVRNKIYAHVLDTELVNTGLPNVSYTHSIKDSVIYFRASRPPFPVQTALFYVNKQISQEACRLFYSKNLFVRLEVYSGDARHAKTMLEDSGVLFSVAAPEAVQRCEAHAMDLTVVEKASAIKRVSVLFPAQYLPRLVNFMEQASKASGSWAPSQALFLTVKNTYALEKAKVQGDLLELFRLLTNVGAVTVESEELLEGYGQDLQNSMMAASFEVETWLKTLTEMAERAEQAHAKEEHDTAAQHCQAVIIAMTYGYLTRAETLHSQPEAFTKAVQRLRWRVELLVASALYSKHAGVTAQPGWLPSPSVSAPDSKIKQTAIDLVTAETASSHALSLATDSPSPSANPWFRSLPAELIPPNKSEWFAIEERGQSWYVLGLVHLALNENLFAAGDLERAVGMLGDEGSGTKLHEEAARAFERAREGIDWTVRPGLALKRAMGVTRHAG